MAEALTGAQARYRLTQRTSALERQQGLARRLRGDLALAQRVIQAMGEAWRADRAVYEGRIERLQIKLVGLCGVAGLNPEVVLREVA